ncbi:MAG: hypothetical protein JWP88_673, partial [Flaviaesturariibacter sp.]|nr:hypothetical protein [Flaviaesturariibacter sp.]
MSRHRILCLALAVFTTIAASAQLGKIPVAVTAAFAKQYTDAQHVSYKDNLSDYTVSFLIDSNKMIAHYNSKGVWKGSEKEVAFDQLATEVKDGFSKSKFADWKVSGATILYLTEKQGGGEQYRVKVSKGE